MQAVLAAAANDVHAGRRRCRCRWGSLGAAAALPLLRRAHAGQRQLRPPAQVGRHMVALPLALAVAALITAALPRINGRLLLLMLLLAGRRLRCRLRLRLRLAAAAAATRPSAKRAIQGLKHLLG